MTLATVSKTTLLVVAPSERLGLSTHSPVQLLPTPAIILDDGLIWDAEISSNERGPERAVVSEVRAVQCSTCGREAQKASSIEIRSDEDEYIDWEIEERCCGLCGCWRSGHICVSVLVCWS